MDEHVQTVQDCNVRFNKGEMLLNYCRVVQVGDKGVVSSYAPKLIEGDVQVMVYVSVYVCACVFVCYCAYRTFSFNNEKLCCGRKRNGAGKYLHNNYLINSNAKSITRLPKVTLCSSTSLVI